jgi:hypothetical protein
MTNVAVGSDAGSAAGRTVEVGVAGLRSTLVGVSIGSGIAISTGPAKNRKNTSPPIPSRPKRRVPDSSNATTMNNLFALACLPFSISFLNLLLS